MLRRARWVVLVCLALTLVPSPGSARDGLTSYTSEHYRLDTDLGEAYATEALAVLEAAWPQLETYFGKAPTLRGRQRLRVRVYRDAGDWKRYSRLGHVKGEWAGMYDGHTASLFRQPSENYTRSLLLHEAVHQFHQRACCPEGRPRDRWYSEGIAEYLSSHTWDGETLRLGVVPLLGGSGSADRVEPILGWMNYKLSATLRSEIPANYPESWAIVRFLSQTTNPDWKAAWRALRTQLDLSRPAREVLPPSLEDPKLLTAMRDWLATQREPMHAVWANWTALDARAVRADAERVSVARVREPITAIQCVLMPPEGRTWRAGLLLRYGGPQDFTSLHLRGSGGWEVHECSGEAWTLLQEGRRRFDLSQPLRLEARRSGEHVSFSVGGARVTSVRVPDGSMGLSIHGCSARFRDIRWTPIARAVSPGLRQR